MTTMSIAEAHDHVAPTINPFDDTPERTEVLLTLEDLRERHPTMRARLHVAARDVCEVSFSLVDGIADLRGPVAH